MNIEGNRIYIENCIDIIGEAGGGGGGGGSGGTSTTNSNSADKPDIDNEICSKQFSSLGCIVDVESKIEENTVASFSWSALFASIHFAVNFEGLPGIEYITDNINPYNYNFKVEVSYKMGSLYNWSGNVFYDCISQKITRTENGSSSLDINWGLVVCGSSKTILYKVNKDSGDKTIIFDTNDGYTGTCIPISSIDRDGLPAQGEQLNKPYNF